MDRKSRERQSWELKYMHMYGISSYMNINFRTCTCRYKACACISDVSKLSELVQARMINTRPLFSMCSEILGTKRTH